MVRILLFVIMMASIDGNAIELSCENANETIVNQLMSTVKTRYSNVEFSDLSVKVMGTELPITCDVLTFEYPKKIDLKGDVVIKFNSYKDDQFQKEPPRYFDYQGMPKCYEQIRLITVGMMFWRIKFMKIKFQSIK